MNVGDLLGSGTISTEDEAGRGSLLELTSGGKHSVKLPDGSERTFLQDGDSITLRGWCGGDEDNLVGFGECFGTIEAAFPVKF